MTQKHASNEQIKKEWAAQASAKEIAEATEAGKGHNSNPQLNPELQADFVAIHKLIDNRKAINDDIRGVVSKMKEKYGLPAGVIRAEISLQRLDQATRAQKEQGMRDVKIMLGIDLFNWQEKVETEHSDIEDPMEAAKAEKASAKVKAVK